VLLAKYQQDDSHELLVKFQMTTRGKASFISISFTN